MFSNWNQKSFNKKYERSKTFEATILLCIVSADIKQLINFFYVNLIAPCSTGQLRLAGGNIANEGRVEICLNNVWGTVCDDHWGSIGAALVCRQLEYSTGSQ